MVKYFLGALCCMLVFNSCEKGEGSEQGDDISLSNAKSALQGSWQQIEKIRSGLLEADFRYFDTEHIHKFDFDATYTSLVNIYGFDDDNPDEIIGQSETLGTYEFRGDSVFIKGKSQTSWDKNFNPKPTTILLTGEAYGSRFKITDDTLTMFYISFPSDGPVQTQMSYKRMP